MPRTWVRSGVVITVPTCRRAQVERLASSSAMRMYTSSRGMRSGSGSAPGRGLTSAIEHMLTGLFIPRFGATLPNMSVLELLFALLLVCLMAGTAVVGVLVWSLVRRADNHARDVAELMTRMQASFQSQLSHVQELRERISQTHIAMNVPPSAIIARPPIT